MKRLCVIMTVVMLLLFVSMPISVCAVENENKTIVTIDDLTVDETNASFSFIVNVETDEAYAGDISYDYDGGEYVLENQRHEISAGYRLR